MLFQGRCRLPVLVALAIGLYPGDVQGQSRALVAPQPHAPAQLEMQETEASKLPRFRDMTFVQKYSLRNNSAANVVALAVRWIHKGEDVNLTAAHRCDSYSAIRLERPLLKGGESKTYERTLKKDHVIEAAIDLVVFDDGALFGANLCRSLDRIQAEIDAMQMVYDEMVRISEKWGAQAAIDRAKARREEYKNGYYNAFTRPKFIGK